MTINNEQIEVLIGEISYRNWRFIFDAVRVALRVSFLTSDAVTNQETLNHGRWWPISRFSTKSEIVQTCLLAVLTAEEHEARERFLYKNARIFGPHFDVDALVDICDELHKDVRPEPQLSQAAMAL